MKDQFEIPYGRTKQILHVDRERIKAVIRPTEQECVRSDEAAIVRTALDNPIASPRLSDLVRGKRRILLITSDHTRPVPSRITMPLLLEEIRAGQPDAEITILIATGMHRPTTQEELISKFGADIAIREKIVVHNAYDESAMAFFGTLPSGGELWLNALLREADLVLSEGFIEPHFFAGFSGGRKSILPGIASERTVRYNHNAGFIASPLARAGSLDGNPIHRDMLYASQQAGLRFILNVLIDSEKHIIGAVTGDPEQAHKAGCAMCEKRVRVQPVIADIAITSNGGYPLDQNVYQSVKGMTAAEACVRPGGVIIMNAALGDGHGGEDFYRWFADRDGPEAVRRDIENIPAEVTRFDQWEAQILARILLKATCIFVTEPENRALIEKMHMRWAPDADSALAEAFEMVGQEATVTVIPDGVGVIL